jgi:kumamolisin
MMFFHKRVDLPGSDRTLPPACEQIGEADGSSLLDVTVVLRRKGNQPLVSSSMLPRLSREEFAQKLGADPADAQAVEQFAHHNHLTVVGTSLEKRRVVLRGNVKHLSKAFGVKLMICRNSQTSSTFRGRTGPLTIPEELKDIVVAVLGLDDRQAAFAHFRIRSAAAAGTAGTFTAADLKNLYNFPQGVDGTGQTIGIIELGGGYTTADLQTYFKGVGLAVPSVTAVSVDGGANTPGSDADGVGHNRARSQHRRLLRPQYRPRLH